MKRCPNSRILAIVATLCLSLIAVSAFAQLQTGNIYGKAQAKDGSALPGVTVTLTGVAAPQTAITDSQGSFHFVNLSPGTYTVKAELSGFGTATRAGLTVSVGQNADITMTLNASMAESITVTAESPLLDVRKAGTGTNVSKIEMEKIPTSRDPWTVLQSVPAVQVDRINVGGSQSGQQSNYYAKGALIRDNTWNMDGVNITDMGATGSSPLYFDFDSFEEMQVTTGGSDPRSSTPGVQLNMVTKRGTNDLRGSGRYMYTPGSLQADASVPANAAYYLDKTNRVNFVRDYGAEVGGPVWKDHLWFWAARADNKISAQASQSPGTIGAFDNIVLRDKNAKLNAQIIASNSAVGFYTWGDKVRNARNLSPTRPFETAWRQTGPTTVYKYEDTQIVGSSLYLTAMWSKITGGFGLFANGGGGESAPAAWRDSAGVWHDNYYTYDTIRPQKQQRLDGSKFFDLGKMNHELKFGFGYRKTPVTSTTVWPGAAHSSWRFDAFSAATCTAQTGNANCGEARVTRDVALGYDEKYRDFYVGDTILMGNLTVQGGLRWDRQQTSNLGVTVGANSILTNPLSLPCAPSVSAASCPGGSIAASLPAVTYPSDPGTLKWNSVSPRIGMTYSLGADKRTLLRAGYNRYASQLGSVVSGANPAAYSAFYFYGVDLNGNHAVERNELVKIRAFPGVNPLNPAAVSITRRVDYGMKVPTTDEFIIGGERELMTDFSVGLNYTYRKYNDLFTTRWEKTQGKGDYYTTDDYVLSTRTAGGTFIQCTVATTIVGGVETCPNTGQAITTITTGTVPLYQLKAGVPSPTYRVLTTRPNYTQQYNGIEVTATKRLSHKWMTRANFSYNNYTETCGKDSFANPTKVLPAINNGSAASGGPTACTGGVVAPQSAGSGAFGNDFINSKWNLNVTALYILPLDIDLGASLSARQGYPQPLRSNTTGLPGGTLNVMLEPMGKDRFDNVYELDLRIAKDFRFMNRVGMTLSGDLFNAPNKRTTLQAETQILNNAAPTTANPSGVTSRSGGNRITELQSPRIWRLGAKFTF
ncbi:MAG TPA: carboxypeptidase regulatory-like domain-containing protein [Thermoanaerobaculia bacterium]|jgi:hypothetical protein|nr:carboxypeptidase regulatory-like domain-containing protein [Thermoanaerobaculia bacterium]